MEKKSLATRATFRRTSTLTKQSISSNLTVPLFHKDWQHRQSRINSDAIIINPIPRLATYVIGPKKKFDFLHAQKFLQLELNRRCQKISKNIRYNSKLSSEFVRDLSQQLRRIIKPDYLTSIRYKIIILISIMQTTQSITIVSRCLWNRETDGSITVQAKLGYDMLVTATVFAVYTD